MPILLLTGKIEFKQVASEASVRQEAVHPTHEVRGVPDSCPLI